MSAAKKASQVKKEEVKQVVPDESPIKVLSNEPTQSQTESDGTSELTPETDDDTTTSEPDEPKTVFQAIGTIDGQVTTQEVKVHGTNETVEGFFIKINQNKYRIYILKNRYRSWLLQMKNNPDKPLYLRVYPKYRIIPRKPPEVYFQVVAWSENNQWEEEPGQFIFRGVWQFIPQVRVPVLSVYRNHGVEDPTGKFKAVHLPVLMRREDGSNPFKFNPRIEKENLPPRYFIQGKFRFIPTKSAWGWMEDLEAPTTDIPWYKKPVKADGKPTGKGDEGKVKDFKKSKSLPKTETEVTTDEKPKEITKAESLNNSEKTKVEVDSMPKTEGQVQIRQVKSKKAKGKKG